MGLKSGAKLTETPIQRVFIGSCTNARIEDPRGGQGCAGIPGIESSPCDGGTREWTSQKAGRKRGLGSHLQGSRFRLARGRLQHVFGDEPRPPQPRRAAVRRPRTEILRGDRAKLAALTWFHQRWQQRQQLPENSPTFAIGDTTHNNAPGAAIHPKKVDHETIHKNHRDRCCHGSGKRGYRPNHPQAVSQED